MVPWQLLQSAMEATKGRRVAEHEIARGHEGFDLDSIQIAHGYLLTAVQEPIASLDVPGDYARGEGTARMQFLSLPG